MNGVLRGNVFESFFEYSKALSFRCNFITSYSELVLSKENDREIRAYTALSDKRF